MEESCPGALTTQKRETCCWPAACFQEDMRNMSSKSKRGSGGKERTQKQQSTFNKVEAVSRQRKPVQSSKTKHL